MRTLLVSLAAALAVTANASARNPRLEQLALRSTDMRLAKGAVLRADDLGAGWTGGATKSDDSAPDCAQQDYSRYTITGQAQTRFAKGIASVVSRVELFPSHRQVVGDFGVDARPGTAACEARALRASFAKQTGAKVSVVSATQRSGPKVGQKSVTFRIVLALDDGKKTAKLYVSVLGFVRDRAAASVLALAGADPQQLLLPLAKSIDARLTGAA